ncbi:MAG: TlpA disulfide reductase family protein [Acidobacteriota bacterium]
MRRVIFPLAIVNIVAVVGLLHAQPKQAVTTAKAIEDQIHTLRSLNDTTRARVTRQLAADILSVPVKERLGLASNLGSLATEGDFGQDTLQAVTDTLESALRSSPAPDDKDGPAYEYFQLAQLAKYEHMKVDLKDPPYTAAMQQLKADDDVRANLNFSLPDLNGTSWTLKSLRGKVVVVNFWATWCPPCRKEMPDLDTLYKRFKDKGLVILALSAEAADVVKPFLTSEQKVTYPVLLDPGGKIAAQFRVKGIPKSFIYDREGKLAAQSIDMRTMDQFLALLKQAGLN